MVANAAGVAAGDRMRARFEARSVDRTTLDEIVARVHRNILETDQAIGPSDGLTIRRAVESAAPLLTVEQVDRVGDAVSRQLFGLGPIEALLADDSIDEIMVNGPGPIWVERHGRLSRASVVVDAQMLAVVIERIVGPLGLRVDRTAPFVDARLDDGSRVHIAVRPLALDGPYVTIRKFRTHPFTLDHFCEPEVASFLAGAVARRASLIVSGGTGSGKTSLLNALANSIAPSERIITIEDAAELRLPGEHVLRLEARPANAEGVGGVPVRTLVRNALRMRPDRIVVGEVRGAEALDMLQAMNTGHEGSMSTCHANSPRDALRRIEAMVLMSDVALPIESVREYVRSALHLVIQVERGSAGQRQVTAVCNAGDWATTWLVRDGALCDNARSWTPAVGG